MEAVISKKPIAPGNEPMVRGGEFLRILDANNRTIELSFSSDIELERWGSIEVLDHSAGCCDLSRLNNGGPLLFNHDLDEVIGVVERATIGADGKGRATVRFSKSEDGEEAWQDVQDGILRNVSVGYRINEVKLKETREDGTDVYVVSKWTPYEISIVSVPADNSVGVGRSLNLTTPSQHPIKMETPAETPVVPAAPSAQVISENRALGESSERDRVRSILAAGRQYDQSELAQKALEDGRTIDQFRTMLLEAVDAKNKSIADSNKPIGMSENEARGFSFVKLFRALSAAPEDRQRFNEAARMELEACAAAADQMTHRSARGTVIPTEVLLSGTRADAYLSSGTSTTAPYSASQAGTIQTQLLSSSFIDLLRNKSIIMGRGTELSGLVGNVDIPKQTGASTASWIGEDTAPDASAITFGIVSLRPRTVTNRGEITRRLLMQNSVGVEALFRADLAKTLALEIDRAALYGTGATNQPTGLKNISGLSSATWTTSGKPTFAELIALETALASSNADQGTMSYIAAPGFRGYAKGAAKFTTPNIYGTIWEDGNMVNGYACDVSNQVTAGDVFFGNWSDLLIGMWGGLDITVDPYTHSDTGRIRVTQFQDVDFNVRRVSSFAYGHN